MRKLSNGYLIAPRRGSPPVPPDGYEQIPGDPYSFRPLIPECEYREIQPPRSYCCGQSDKLFCKAASKRVIRITCVECQARPEWIKNR